MTSLKHLTALAAVAGALLLAASSFAAAPSAPAPHLIPYPRQAQWRPGAFRIGPAVSIVVLDRYAADRFAARLLRRELMQVEGVRALIGPARTAHRIELARVHSRAGRYWLRRAGLAGRFPLAASAEGYLLLVTRSRAVIVGDSAAGVFYGVETLRQLLRPAGRAHHALAPCARILDWPALRWRGVHQDISRGPVPRLSDIKRTVARLAEFKLNAYSLYFENTYAYPSLPLVGEPGGAINPAEARAIVAFARRYHVTVIPEQESFGHLHLALQYQQYQPLDELPFGDVLSPAVPGTMDFIHAMFADLARVFPSPFLHIGADETFQLGQGKTKPMVEQLGRGQVYINFLRNIYLSLQPFHRKVMFWGDIAVKHPELLSQLPRDMVAVPWDYAPRPSYDREIQPFRAAGLETWVSPGVGNWSHIYPDYATALPNIRVFVADGKRLGAVGMLNTTWMDDGEALFDNAWYGLVYGAAASWEPHLRENRFRQDYDWAFYRAPGHHFEQQVEQLTQIQTQMRQCCHVDGLDWTVELNPFSARGQRFYQRLAPSAPPIRLLAEQVIADLAQNRNLARHNADLLDQVAFSARRFDFLGQKAEYAVYIPQLYAQARAETNQPGKVMGILYRINGVNGLLQDMRDHTSELRIQYRKLWLEGNRPYFLPNILVRYDRELLAWQRLADRVTSIQANFRRTHQLPASLSGAPAAVAAGASAHP